MVIRVDYIEYKGEKYYIKNGRLVLSSLGITDILEIKGLTKFNDLEELYLGGNSIKEIRGLDSLNNLKKLRLGGNQITEINGLDNLKNLQSLRLSGNKITEIKGLENLITLQYLKLNENPINEEEFFLIFKDPVDVVKFCRKKFQHQILKEEDQEIEHKESFRWDVKKGKANTDLKNEVTKAICGFLNSQGGTVVIGVDDSGKTKGIEPDLKTYDKNDKRKAKDKFHQDIKKTIRENLGTKVVNNINIFFKKFDENEMVIIEVKPAIEPIYHLDEDFIIRDGPASPKLKGKQLGNYIYTHFCLQNTKLNILFQKFYNLLFESDNKKISILLEVILDQIGSSKIQEIIQMRYSTTEEGIKILIELNEWVLTIKRWEEVKIVRMKPPKKDFSFKFPSFNKEILNEYLELLKYRCEESGISIVLPSY